MQLFTIDTAAFEGHFPGNPALPGIAQLALAARELAPRGVRRVKFRDPIRQGGQLGVALEPRDGGDVAFAIHDGAGGPVVTDGVFTVGPEAPAIEMPPPPAFAARTDLPPLEVMLPHRGPALFLTDVLHVPSEPSRATWFAGRVPRENVVVDGDRTPTLATIELTCQAGAVAAELVRAVDGTSVRALHGLLGAVRNASFATPDFATGTQLVAAIVTTTRASFVNVTAQIATRSTDDLEPLASVELTILVLG